MEKIPNFSTCQTDYFYQFNTLQYHKSCQCAIEDYNYSISLQECGFLLGFLAPFRRYIAYSILHISITEASCTPSLLLTVTKSIVYLHIINLCIFRTVVTIIIIGCQLTLLNMYVRKVTKLISKITAFTLVSYVVRFCSLAE